MSAKGKKDEWSIPENIKEYVGELYPNGIFICCRVCSECDAEGRAFGLVKLIGPCWYSYFCDHLKSERHLNNCVRKLC